MNTHTLSHWLLYCSIHQHLLKCCVCVSLHAIYAEMRSSACIVYQSNHSYKPCKNFPDENTLADQLFSSLLSIATGDYCDDVTKYERLQDTWTDDVFVTFKTILSENDGKYYVVRWIEVLGENAHIKVVDVMNRYECVFARAYNSFFFFFFNFFNWETLIMFSFKQSNDFRVYLKIDTALGSSAHNPFIFCPSNAVWICNEKETNRKK